jgi:hypothetical protein
MCPIVVDVDVATLVRLVGAVVEKHHAHNEDVRNQATQSETEDGKQKKHSQ